MIDPKHVDTQGEVEEALRRFADDQAEVDRAALEVAHKIGELAAAQVYEMEARVAAGISKLRLEAILTGLESTTFLDLESTALSRPPLYEVPSLPATSEPQPPVEQVEHDERAEYGPPIPIKEEPVDITVGSETTSLEEDNDTEPDNQELEGEHFLSIKKIMLKADELGLSVRHKSMLRLIAESAKTNQWFARKDTDFSSVNFVSKYALDQAFLSLMKRMSDTGIVDHEGRKSASRYRFTAEYYIPESEALAAVGIAAESEELPDTDLVLEDSFKDGFILLDPEHHAVRNTVIEGHFFPGEIVEVQIAGPGTLIVDSAIRKIRSQDQIAVFNVFFNNPNTSFRPNDVIRSGLLRSDRKLNATQQAFSGALTALNYLSHGQRLVEHSGYGGAKRIQLAPYVTITVTDSYVRAMAENLEESQVTTSAEDQLVESDNNDDSADEETFQTVDLPKSEETDRPSEPEPKPLPSSPRLYTSVIDPVPARTLNHTRRIAPHNPKAHKPAPRPAAVVAGNGQVTASILHAREGLDERLRATEDTLTPEETELVHQFQGSPQRQRRKATNESIETDIIAIMTGRMQPGAFPSLKGLERKYFRMAMDKARIVDGKVSDWESRFRALRVLENKTSWFTDRELED